MTIITFGAYCIHLNNVMKRTEQQVHDIKGTKLNFENNVEPLVEDLKGLNGVAEGLLKEAMGKRAVIKEFEEEVKHKRDIFGGQATTALVLQLAILRKKMVRDLDDLMAQCVKTMAESAAREEEFRTILVDVTEQEAKNKLINLMRGRSNIQIYII